MSLFNCLESLTKAAIGVVVDVPVSIASDIVTMGGVLADKEKPYTADALECIVENVKESTK